MRIGIQTLMIVLLSHVPSHAILEWNDDLTVRYAAAPDTMATAVYVFRNVADRPITIKNVRPSCNCTTADLEKRAYAPGETGIIVARVDLTGKHSFVENTIEVEHEDGMLRIDRLRMNVEIGRVAEISPVFHYWDQGGIADTKVSIIEPFTAGRVSIVRIEPSDRTFAWDVVQSEDRCELRVWPVNLARKARTTFRITIQVGDSSAVQTVYAHVR